MEDLDVNGSSEAEQRARCAHDAEALKRDVESLRAEMSALRKEIDDPSAGWLAFAMGLFLPPIMCCVGMCITDYNNEKPRKKKAVLANLIGSLFGFIVFLALLMQIIRWAVIPQTSKVSSSYHCLTPMNSSEQATAPITVSKYPTGPSPHCPLKPCPNPDLISDFVDPSCPWVHSWTEPHVVGLYVFYGIVLGFLGIYVIHRHIHVCRQRIKPDKDGRCASAAYNASRSEEFVPENQK